MDRNCEEVTIDFANLPKPITVRYYQICILFADYFRTLFGGGDRDQQFPSFMLLLLFTNYFRTIFGGGDRDLQFPSFMFLLLFTDYFRTLFGGGD